GIKIFAVENRSVPGKAHYFSGTESEQGIRFQSFVIESRNLRKLLFAQAFNGDFSAAVAIRRIAFVGLEAAVENRHHFRLIARHPDALSLRIQRKEQFGIPVWKDRCGSQWTFVAVLRYDKSVTFRKVG